MPGSRTASSTSSLDDGVGVAIPPLVVELNASQEPVAPEKLDHYAKTLAMARDRFPQLPFLSELDDELDKLNRPGISAE